MNCDKHIRLACVSYKNIIVISCRDDDAWNFIDNVDPRQR